MGFHVDMAELIKLRDAYLKDSTAAAESLEGAKGAMNGIITSNAMYGEVGKAITDEINNSHNAIIVGLKDSYTVMSGEFSSAVSDFQSSVGETNESAILDEEVMTQTGTKVEQASTKHGTFETDISSIYSSISDLVSLSSPKSSVESSLSEAKKILTDAVEKVTSFDGAGQEPQVNQLLTAFDTQITYGNQAQALSYTDPTFVEFAGYSALAEGVTEINNNIEEAKRLAAEEQKKLKEQADEQQRKEEEEWAQHHPLQAMIKGAQKACGDWWDDVKAGTKNIKNPLLRETLLFGEGFVGAAGSFVSDTALMAVDLGQLALESNVVLYGGLADKLLGTKLTPDWMKKDVDGTINNIKGFGDYLGKFATDGKAREQAMKSMGQAWDNMVEGFKKDPAYSLGGAAFDVASMLVGAGEVKAGLSAAKATQGIVRGINTFGKTVGKAAVKNASAMAKNMAHLATRGPGLSKSIGKAAMVKMKKVNKAFSNALDHISSKFDEAYAYAEGFFSKDFTKHKARVYQSSGGDWDRVVRETFGEYEDPFRKQILNNIEESKRAREASNFSDYLKKEKEVLEKVEFNDPDWGKNELSKLRDKWGVPETDTIAVGKTDIPALKGQVFEGGSPKVRKEAGLPDLDEVYPDREIRSPRANALFTRHAEEGVIQEFVDKVNKLDLSENEIEGVFKLHQSNSSGVCGACKQGLTNPDVKPGILKQFSTKYPNLTIDITTESAEIGSKLNFSIKNGQVIK